jgi:hypothetical protein
MDGNLDSVSSDQYSRRLASDIEERKAMDSLVGEFKIATFSWLSVLNAMVLIHTVTCFGLW